MDAFFIFSAKYLFILPLLILAGYFLLRQRSSQKKIFIFAFPSLVLTYLVALLAGSLYYDPRPFVVGHFVPLIPHVPDNGFPSDHALLVSAVAAVGTCFNRRLGAILWLLALIVATARVYVGLHHLIDVVGSFTISILVTLIVYFFYTYVWHKEII